MIQVNPTQFSRIFLDMPYRDGIKNIKNSIYQEKIDTVVNAQLRTSTKLAEPSLEQRTMRFLVGIALCVPVVNIPIDLIIRHLNPTEEIVTPSIVPADLAILEKYPNLKSFAERIKTMSPREVEEEFFNGALKLQVLGILKQMGCQDVEFKCSFRVDPAAKMPEEILCGYSPPLLLDYKISVAGQLVKWSTPFACNLTVSTEDIFAGEYLAEIFAKLSKLQINPEHQKELNSLSKALALLQPIHWHCCGGCYKLN